jgi:adenylate kinase
MVLLGAPGCGKGTQGERLREKYAVPQISTGEMLRAAISAGTALGEETRERVAAGALVSDEIMLGLMRERLRAPDAADGFILDGFPRSIPQAEGLDVLLEGWGTKLDAVVKLDVSKKLLLDRLTSRRICPHCGATYNVLTRPPQQEGICDRDGSRLVLREDDSEGTVRRRLHVYESATAPLIDYYDAHKLLAIVGGEGAVDTIFRRICSAIEQRAGKTA